MHDRACQSQEDLGWYQQFQDTRRIFAESFFQSCDLQGKPQTNPRTEADGRPRPLHLELLQGRLAQSAAVFWQYYLTWLPQYCCMWLTYLCLSENQRYSNCLIQLLTSGSWCCRFLFLDLLVQSVIASICLPVHSSLSVEPWLPHMMENHRGVTTLSGLLWFVFKLKWRLERMTQPRFDIWLVATSAWRQSFRGCKTCRDPCLWRAFFHIPSGSSCLFSTRFQRTSWGCSFPWTTKACWMSLKPITSKRGRATLASLTGLGTWAKFENVFRFQYLIYIDWIWIFDLWPLTNDICMSDIRLSEVLDFW